MQPESPDSWPEAASSWALRLGASGDSKCESLISAPPSWDLGLMRSDHVILPEWWMNRPTSEPFWAWSSSVPSYPRASSPDLFLPLGEDGRKAGSLVQPRAGEDVSIRGRLAKASTPNSLCLPCLPASGWLRSPTPRGLPLSPWRSLGRSSRSDRGGHSPPLPCPQLFSEKTGPFPSAIQGLPPLWRILRSNFT